MPVATPTQAPSSIYSELWNGLKLGTGVMLVQSPLLNACNRVSVIGCDRNLPLHQSILQIYRGVIDKKPPSLMHFLKGIDAHLVKETARVGFKSAALAVLLPRLREYYKHDPNGKHKVNAIFAGFLAAGEIAINPVDTLRTMWQANRAFSVVPRGERFSHLYKGAGLNGLRIYGIWWGFLYADTWTSDVLKQHTSINPGSPFGIFARSLPLSVIVTTPVWILECLKNRLQCLPELTATGTKTSRVFATAKHIFRTQGLAGFIRGYGAKVGYHMWLAIGALLQAEEGKRAHQAKLAQQAKLTPPARTA